MPGGFDAKSMIPAPSIAAALSPTRKLVTNPSAFGFAESIIANSTASKKTAIPHASFDPPKKVFIAICPNKAEVTKNPTVVRQVSHAGMTCRR